MAALEPCPLCGSETVDPYQDAKEALRPNHYVTELERLSDSPGGAATVATVKCTTCGLLYRTPYFDNEDVARLFLQGVPQHLQGWRNLEKVLAGERRSGYAAPPELLEWLRMVLGGISLYGEYGCPFQGYLVGEMSSNESLSNTRNLLTRWRYPFLRKNEGRNAFAQSIANRLAPPRGVFGRDTSPRPSNVRPLGDRRFIVHDESVMRWNLGCINYGRSCWQLASCLPNISILSRAEVSTSLRGQRLSLLCFFDTLDHCFDLQTVLDWSFSASDAILVVGHREDSAGLQHRFALTSASLDFVAAKYSGWTLTDVANEVDFELDRSHFWILFRRSSTAAK